jgi:formamidopyrimidine-DNA glycosylase
LVRLAELKILGLEKHQAGLFAGDARHDSMPELPEVETMRRGIAPIVGSRIEDMECPRSRLCPITIEPPLGRFRRRVAGRSVVSVGRAGKRVLLELDSGDRIVIEPRMTGRVLIQAPPDAGHVRVVFRLSGGAAEELLFWDSRGLGVVRLLAPADFVRRLGPDKLGPDALAISAKELGKQLGASRRAIKVALLDQSVLAGVGNLYASELLHRAKLPPELPCSRLRPADWQRVQAAMQEVLQEALAHQGSTLADGTYRTVQGEAGRYQDQHRVYQRAGQPCVQCGKSKIMRIVQVQRSTFYCPNCQRPRRGYPRVGRS